MTNAVAAVEAEEALPAGACDCHTHVVGDASRYPMLAGRPYTPAAAPHEALLAHLQRHGLQRVVIVQPSFYGSDNRCLLDSLARLDGAGRGVAVLDEAADDATLARLHRAGVRGLRVNVESTGGRDAAAVGACLSRWAGRLAERGWHLQVYASFDTLAALAPVLAGLAVPVVLDHFAMVSLADDEPAAVGRATQQLLALLASGKVYLKLSAPYRIAARDPVARAAPLALALAAAHPQRLLWGSDWPHTQREPGRAAHEPSRYREVDGGLLVGSITQWLPGEALRRQVLVDNPARLYGF